MSAGVGIDPTTMGLRPIMIQLAFTTRQVGRTGIEPATLGLKAPCTASVLPTLAAGAGIEPTTSGSKPTVIPFHHPAMEGAARVELAISRLKAWCANRYTMRPREDHTSSSQNWLRNHPHGR